MSFGTRLTAFGVITLALLACESNQSRPGGTDTSTIVAQQRQSADALLAQAERSDPQTKFGLMLEAAQILAQSGDVGRARSIINNLPPQTNLRISTAQAARLALVRSYIATADGYYVQALEYLEAPPADYPSALPLELAHPILEQKATLLHNMGNYPASLEERVRMHDLLGGRAQESADNQQRLWQTLMEIPSAELGKLLAEGGASRDLEGWYRLALLSKDTQANIREQLARLDRWMLEWSDHPASVNLPADLQMLRQILSEQPQQIALLLPFSGKLASAANAIRDGFMAAYYQHRQLESDAPALRFYDTEQQDINAVYDQALADGAQLIIGPLAKEQLQDLALRPALPVPTLALNTIDNPLGTVANLFQFGLGVEDEARQAAEQAWRDGHRRAMILAPNNNWGDRSVNTFITHWRNFGGEIVKEYRYSEKQDYSKLLKQALQLDLSEKRAQEIRALIGNVQFEPRRRQDIDLIFLVAQANEARQVKPTLAFHYAADIPVYSTSQVYSGVPDSKLDQDMNGIKFSTLPWFFERQAAEKKALEKFADNSAALQPLYAMGVDSFHLYPRLKQLEAVREANFYGLTGTLRLNEQQQFQRQQVWAEFRNGRPRVLAESF